MILCIDGVLDAGAVQALTAELEQGRLVSGAATAGWHARTVKRNLQLAGDDPAVRKAGERVREALAEHAVFRMGVQPRTVRLPLFSRYEPGMTYGAHVDDAVMVGDAATLRTDVAVTVFLSAPEDYAGGELVMDTPGGEQAYKLPAGAAIAYPADTLHHVAPVTEGVRLAAVTWVQSLVRDPRRREVLFDLDTARRALFDQGGKGREFDLVSKSHANLLRMWADV